MLPAGNLENLNDQAGGHGQFLPVRTEGAAGNILFFILPMGDGNLPNVFSGHWIPDADDWVTAGAGNQLAVMAESNREDRFCMTSICDQGPSASGVPNIYRARQAVDVFLAGASEQRP